MPRHTLNETRVRCGGPGDALDAIPWMLGFAPTESLVMLCLNGPRSQFGPVLRFDLPDPAVGPVLVAEALALLLERTTCREALLVVYTDQGSADPLSPLPRQELLLEARRQFGAVKVGIRDAVVARHGRWWSLLCDDPLCCPPEGTPIEHDVPSAVQLAYLSTGAFPPMPSRGAITESLRQRPSDALMAELERLAGAAPGLGTDTLMTQLRDVVEHANGRRARLGAGSLEPATIALLIFLVQHIPVRDEATEIPCDDELAEAVGLWQEVYVSCPDAYRPDVGGILAALAWEAGAGALATCACESVLEIDADHRLTLLITSLLANGIRPDPRDTRSQTEARARAAQRAARRAARRQRPGNRSRSRTAARGRR